MKQRFFLPALCLLAAVLGAPHGRAQVLDPALGISTIPLWPSGAPEVAGADAADRVDACLGRRLVFGISTH